MPLANRRGEYSYFNYAKKKNRSMPLARTVSFYIILALNQILTEIASRLFGSSLSSAEIKNVNFVSDLAARTLTFVIKSASLSKSSPQILSVESTRTSVTS